jgi:hypothetical protein
MSAEHVEVGLSEAVSRKSREEALEAVGPPEQDVHTD